MMSDDEVNEFFANRISRVNSCSPEELVNQKFTVEDYTRVLLTLHNESVDAIETGTTPVKNFVTQMIRLKNDVALDAYLKTLIDDTKEAKDNPKYQKIMPDLYRSYSTHKELDDESDESNEPLHIRIAKEVPYRIFMGALYAGAIGLLSKIPQEKILKVLEQKLAYKFTSKDMVFLAMALVLGTIQLIEVSISSIWEWYDGKISGKRCIEQIVGVYARVGGIYVGSVGGAMAATEILEKAVIAGTAGGLVVMCATLTGSVFVSWTAQELTKSLSCWLLDIDKDKKLENAYRFLGVPRNAQNQEIDKTYRQLALQYHPDKGGDKNEFLKLQIRMAVIRKAREEAL